jgi:hypothetical protein
MTHLSTIKSSQSTNALISPRRHKLASTSRRETSISLKILLLRVTVASMPVGPSVSVQPMLQPAPEIVQEKRPTGRPPRRAPVNATMIAQVILNRPLGSGEASVAGHMLEITEQARAAAAATAAALVNGHGTKESPIMLGDEADPNAKRGCERLYSQ